MKSKCRGFTKALYIFPYAVFFSFSDIIMPAPQECGISERLWNSIFGVVTAGEIQSLVPSMESIGAVFLFCLLYGQNISEFWGPAGSMFFTRLRDRRRWGWGKIIELYGFALVYTVGYLAVKLLVAIRGVTMPDIGGKLFLTGIVLTGLLSMVFTLTCLFINLVSIRHGIAVSVFGIFALVIVLDAVGILLFDHAMNIILNPFCFNFGIMDSMLLAGGKIAVEFIYVLILSAGAILYIDCTDIW